MDYRGRWILEGGNIVDKLDLLLANEYKDESGFVSKAQYLRDNWPWLKYSYAISLKVRRRMKELGITQKELAQELGCTQQHVSTLLGGRANMTLETLAKLEQALHFDLVGNSLNVSGDSISPFDEESPYPAGTRNLANVVRPRKKKGPKADQ